MIKVAITGQNGWTNVPNPSMAIQDNDPMNLDNALVIFEGSLRTGSTAAGTVIGKCGYNPGVPYFTGLTKTFLVAHDKGTNPVKLQVRDNGEIVYLGGLFTEQVGATVYLDGINFFLGNV